MIPDATRPWVGALVIALALMTGTSCKSGAPTAPGGAKELDSGDFGPGDGFQHRFAAAGTYAYHCTHHPMRGTVRVMDAAPDTLVNVNIISSSTDFPAASLKPGGRVVWTNNTQDVHTVTSD